MKRIDIVFNWLWVIYGVFILSNFWISYPKIVRIVGYSLGLIYMTVKLFFRKKDIKDASQTSAIPDDILRHDELTGDAETN